MLPILPWRFFPGKPTGQRSLWKWRPSRVKGRLCYAVCRVDDFTPGFKAQIFISFRRRSGLKRSAMGRACGMLAADVSRLERGEVVLPPGQWRRLLPLARRAVEAAAA